MNKLILILKFLLCILAVAPIEQRLTLFSERDQKGRGFIFTFKEPDTTKFNSIILLVRSYCVSGIWGIYEDTVYNKPYIRLISPDQETCMNFNISWKSISSLRYFGQENLESLSITLYAEEFYAGREFTIIDKSGSELIPFKPKSLFITGASPWSLFRGDFQAPIFCFEPTEHILGKKFGYYPRINYSGIYLGTNPSVIKGC